MDARELTKAQYEDRNRIIELEKQVTFLTQECEKLRLLMDVLNVSVKMLEGKR